MADNLPGPPQNTGQATHKDLEQTKVYLDILRRMVEANFTTLESAAILKSIVDAKGDLIAATGADTPVRVAVGANRTILEADSAASPGVAWVARALGLKSVQVFTSSGTWTRPTGIRKVLVEVVGGGGGAGGVVQGDPTSSSGGAAGGMGIKIIDVSAISSSTITIGAAGAGGAAGANAGTAGGNSSWADGTNTVTGNGGAASAGGNSTAVNGGTATGGDLNVTGNSSDNGNLLTGLPAGGNGGVARYGTGGKGARMTGAGSNGANGGGGGGACDNNTAARAGGSGGDGLIVVWEFE